MEAQNQTNKQDDFVPKEKNDLVYDTHETPPLGEWILLSIQHVFAMFGATILVPIIVNGALGAEIIPIPVALVASGIGTIIYAICSRGKVPVYQGSSFAFIAPIIAGFAVGGAAGVYSGIATAGLVYVVVAILIKIFGKDWIDKVLPPVVIGPMIMLIGLGLAYVAIDMIGITKGATLEWKPLLVSIVTFLTTATVALYTKGILKIIPFLIGIVVGYILAATLGLVNFQPFFDAKFFALPEFQLIFKDWQFEPAALLIIVPVAIVTICEHIGDHTAMSNILNRNLLKHPGLDKTLLGDGIATTVSGLIGGPASTTYGENQAVVGMTKVASVKVILLAAVISIGFGFLAKLSALFGSIPSAVLGGVSIILFGFIAVVGLRLLIQKQVDFMDTKNVIVAATIFVLGLGGATLSWASGSVMFSLGGLALAAIVGILLNLILPAERK